MRESLLKSLKAKLKKERARLEEELEKLAKENQKLKGRWDLRFPKFNGGEAGSGILEKAADEVEEYSTLLPIKYNFEQKLKEINLALEKIKKKEYGICEKCQKEIEEERLKICPEARLCRQCVVRRG